MEFRLGLRFGGGRFWVVKRFVLSVVRVLFNGIFWNYSFLGLRG